MNGAPDSWEDGADINDKLAQLNVDAPSFVPNVNAAVFVPSFLPAAPVEAAPVPVAATPTVTPVHTAAAVKSAVAPPQMTVRNKIKQYIKSNIWLMDRENEISNYQMI